MRMGHKRLRFVGLIAVAMVLVVACGSSGGGTPAKTFKIGLVTDTGGLNDKSFNHLADVGLEKAKTDFKIQGDVKESKTGADYIPNLTDFASKNYDLVIGVGFLMQQAEEAFVVEATGVGDQSDLECLRRRSAAARAAGHDQDHCDNNQTDEPKTLVTHPH